MSIASLLILSFDRELNKWARSVINRTQSDTAMRWTWNSWCVLKKERQQIYYWALPRVLSAVRMMHKWNELRHLPVGCRSRFRGPIDSAACLQLAAPPTRWCPKSADSWARWGTRSSTRIYPAVQTACTRLSRIKQQSPLTILSDQLSSCNYFYFARAQCIIVSNFIRDWR